MVPQGMPSVATTPPPPPLHCRVLPAAYPTFLPSVSPLPRLGWLGSIRFYFICVPKGCLVPSILSGKIAVHGPIDWANGDTLQFRHTGKLSVILRTGCIGEGIRSAYTKVLALTSKTGVLGVGVVASDSSSFFLSSSEEESSRHRQGDRCFPQSWRASFHCDVM